MSGWATTKIRLRAIARRHAYVLVRSPHRLFDVTLWPLVDVVLFGALASFVGDADRSVAGQTSGYLIAGIVLWHIVYQSQIALSTGFLEETWSRNLLNLMVSPVREIEYVAGVALFGMVKLILGVGVMVLAAFAFFSFDTWSLGWSLVPIGAVLLVVGWAVSMFVIGLVLRFGSGAEALAWGVMFIFLPLSGVFYPIDALPELFQPLARVLPTTHAFGALRGVVDGEALDWGQIGGAAAGAFGLLALSFVYLVRMLKLFRTRGYITRYT